jgi:hypothetical protein
MHQVIVKSYNVLATSLMCLHIIWPGGSYAKDKA